MYHGGLRWLFCAACTPAAADVMPYACNMRQSCMVLSTQAAGHSIRQANSLFNLYSPKTGVFALMMPQICTLMTAQQQVASTYDLLHH